MSMLSLIFSNRVLKNSVFLDIECTATYIGVSIKVGFDVCQSEKGWEIRILADRRESAGKQEVETASYCHSRAIRITREYDQLYSRRKNVKSE